MNTPLQILERYWQHKAFRPQQEAIINSVLGSNDTLALLPTGGGKSVCFQVPAMLMNGTCLVISPLIALMRDQVDALNKKGISAVSIYSGLTQFQVKQAIEDVANGKYKFLYCSPERLESKLLLDYLPTLKISLLVIDEAHCISQWGYDFRPPYLRIAAVRKLLPKATLIALTASATPMVQADIIEKLQLKDTAVFRQSFERPNISYSNFLVESKPNKIIEILQKVPGSSIVYCNNRRQTKKIADTLAMLGIAADYYHAGLSGELRAQKQLAWIDNKIRVMVCTNAFGMGIDKPDVRTVIHHDIPDCLENYYQEAGRAGRDGKRAYAVLVYQKKDPVELKKTAARKFPSIQVIREVYQAIADFLQIPIGIGEGQFYDFDFSTFIRRFKLEAVLVMNVLKVLEQEGHLQFAESIFLPTKVGFICDRATLEQVEKTDPTFESLIKALLRTYEGIFEDIVSIYEMQVAKVAGMNVATVPILLAELAKKGIIQYTPRKESPQIQFLLNRAPAAYLYIAQDQYLDRKKRYEERLSTMLQYTQSLSDCRSNYIGAYFGDAERENCGICDNCLAKKRKSVSTELFVQIEQQLRMLSTKKQRVEDLVNTLSAHKTSQVWEVIEFLQSEEKITLTDTHEIKWLV